MDRTIGDCAIGEVVEVLLASGWTRAQTVRRDARGRVTVRPMMTSPAGYQNLYVHFTLPPEAPVREVDSGVVYAALVA